MIVFAPDGLKNITAQYVRTFPVSSVITDTLSRTEYLYVIGPIFLHRRSAHLSAA